MSEEDKAKYTDQHFPILKQRQNPLERDEHRIFTSWLSLHNFECVRHSRTDRKTTEPIGVPDFSVYDKWRPDQERTDITRTLLIEFKLPGRKMSLLQELWASHCSGKVHLVHSASEAIALVAKHFGT